MKKIVFIFGLILVFALGFVIFVSQTQKNITKTENVRPVIDVSNKTVDYKASFAIFTSGTYRIFTDSRYHNQSDDVYMEEANIVIVKRQDATWADFFETLPMTLRKDCLLTGTGQEFCTNQTQKLRFFINAKEDPDALDKEIKEGDKLLVTYGNETEEQVKQQLEQVPSP